MHETEDKECAPKVIFFAVTTYQPKGGVAKKKQKKGGARRGCNSRKSSPRFGDDATASVGVPLWRSPRPGDRPERQADDEGFWPGWVATRKA
jgi:hypothetical protein